MGLDFTHKTSPSLQWIFLPQFVILYLSFFVRQSTPKKDNDSDSLKVVYKRNAFMMLIEFFDVVSANSFHLLFLAIGLLGTLWSLNFVMLIYFVIFGIHYISSQRKYLSVIKKEPKGRLSSQEKDDIIKEETKIQKALGIHQRRNTLRFILAFSLISLILTQGFAFVQIYIE